MLATRNLTQTTNLAYDSVYHTARFTGLEAKTKYLYRLGDGTNWSEWYEFQTASANAEPFSFIYYGDAQNDLQEHWSRVVRQTFKDAPETKLFVHAGDLIDSSTSDSQWGEWFRAGHWINGMVPSFATTGNHEYSGSTLRRSGTARSRGRRTARRARASSPTRSRAPRSTRTSRASGSSR